MTFVTFSIIAINVQSADFIKLAREIGFFHGAHLKTFAPLQSVPHKSDTLVDTAAFSAHVPRQESIVQTDFVQIRQIDLIGLQFGHLDQIVAHLAQLFILVHHGRLDTFCFAATLVDTLHRCATN
jgi:hypothetical protein